MKRPKYLLELLEEISFNILYCENEISSNKKSKIFLEKELKVLKEIRDNIKRKIDTLSEMKA